MAKDDTRLELVRKRAQEAGCTLAYLAMIGGQDELVFDGDSIVVSAAGEVITRAPQFEEGCVAGRPRPAGRRRGPVARRAPRTTGLGIDHRDRSPRTRSRPTSRR